LEKERIPEFLLSILLAYSGIMERERESKIYAIC
jgi:hypothetical protein